MTSHLNGIELDKNLAELRSSAKSLTDINDWFQLHPYILIGDITTPTPAKIDIKLDIDNPRQGYSTRSANILSWAAKHAELGLISEISISYSYASRAWSKDGTGEAKDRPTKLSNKEVIGISLELWPFATAVVTTEYFLLESTISLKSASFREEVELNLNRCLPLHFPGMSLDKLSGMVSGDILDVNSDPGLFRQQICDVLFATRATEVQLALPEELVTGD